MPDPDVEKGAGAGGGGSDGASMRNIQPAGLGEAMRLLRESGDEGGQIQGEGNHPEEREGGDVGRNVARGSEQHQGRDRRRCHPEAASSPRDWFEPLESRLASHRPPRVRSAAMTTTAISST